MRERGCEMELADYFPIWDRLTDAEREVLKNSVSKRTVPKGTLLHNGSNDCVGLFIICSGQLRAFILSDEGKEVTLYRLFERDICLLSASCMSIPTLIVFKGGKAAATQVGLCPLEALEELCK